MEKIKIRLKENGKTDYCYDNAVRDGFFVRFGHTIPKYTHKYYKDKEMTQELNKDDFDIIPWEPFELFGVECGKGWHELLKPIFNYIEEYNKDKADEDRMEICQIKEKWGELCVYLNFYNDEVKALIDAAEKEASVTCELCGSKEDVGMTVEGWLTTECHNCVKNWCKEHERPQRWRRNDDNKIYWVNPDGEDELLKKEELP